MAVAARVTRPRVILRAVPDGDVGLSCLTHVYFTGEVVWSSGPTVAVRGVLVLDVDDQRYRLAHLELDGDGDYPNRRAYGDVELTADVYHAVPIGAIVRDAGWQALTVHTFDGEQAIQHVGPETLDQRQLTVAAYLRARLVGLDTNTVIASELGIGVAAATKRVQRLRAAGALPPARPGRRK